MYNDVHRLVFHITEGGSSFLRRPPRLNLDLLAARRACSSLCRSTRPHAEHHAKTKPNEAKWSNVNIMSKMREKFRKRSQMSYPQFFQCIRTKKRPFFRKNARFGRDGNDNWGFSSRQCFRPKLECAVESVRSAAPLSHPSMNWKATELGTESRPSTVQTGRIAVISVSTAKSSAS